MTDEHYSKQKPKIRVRKYKMRNTLKAKAMAGFRGGGKESEEHGISKKMLQQAQAEFNKMADEYPQWVQSYLNKLTRLVEVCKEQPDKRHLLFKKLAEMAHDLKGQGGTFGYPLISKTSDSLFNFTEEMDGKILDNHVEIVKAHVDVMKAVINGRVEGDGGDIGKALMQELRAAIKRHS